jgi:hypothetical protein
MKIGLAVIGITKQKVATIMSPTANRIYSGETKG